MGGCLTYTITDQVDDPEWDTSLANFPDGHHLQSNFWASFKESSGWKPFHLLLKRDDCIVAGSQVLVRKLPCAMRIAHVLEGPVFRSYEPALFAMVIDHLITLIRTHKINYLALQPSRCGSAVEELDAWGFQTSRILRGDRASLLLDLSEKEETLLSLMRRTTRNNTRLAENQGARVREGGEADLVVFHQLVTATSRRRKFTPESYAYYKNLWRHLEPSKHVKLFFTEYKGEVLSGLLVIPFGSTVVAKRFG